jgi:hypothetical protein
MAMRRRWWIPSTNSQDTDGLPTRDLLAESSRASERPSGALRVHWVTTDVDNTRGGPKLPWRRHRCIVVAVLSYRGGRDWTMGRTWDTCRATKWSPQPGQSHRPREIPPRAAARLGVVGCEGRWCPRDGPHTQGHEWLGRSKSDWTGGSTGRHHLPSWAGAAEGRRWAEMEIQSQLDFLSSFLFTFLSFLF